MTHAKSFLHNRCLDQLDLIEFSGEIDMLPDFIMKKWPISV